MTSLGMSCLLSSPSVVVVVVVVVEVVAVAVVVVIIEVRLFLSDFTSALLPLSSLREVDVLEVLLRLAVILSLMIVVVFDNDDFDSLTARWCCLVLLLLLLSPSRSASIEAKLTLLGSRSVNRRGCRTRSRWGSMESAASRRLTLTPPPLPTSPLVSELMFREADADDLRASSDIQLW